MRKGLKKLALLGALCGIFLCGSLTFVACKGNGTSESQREEQETAEFSLNMHMKEMSLYDTFTLSVENYDDIEWVSDNSAIVSVDENGVVTANAYGQANVSATKGDKTDSCLIIVLDEGKVPEIAVNTDGDEFSLLEGDTFNLGCNVKFNGNYFTDGTFTYQSSNPTVASVNADGLITAGALGTTTVTVQGKWRGFDESYLHKEILVSVVSNISMSLSTVVDVVYNKNETVDGVSYANTCNLSEDWVGYSTRYGDSVGDFSPCSFLTVAEMKQIGHLLGLPENLVEKTPIDGLCGKTDEDNLGFTYAELDAYIRDGILPSPEKKEVIDRKHERNLFKLQLMQTAPQYGYPDILK